VLILLVDALWHISKVRHPVVASVAVDVINLILRPFTRMDEPRQSMEHVKPAIELYTQISIMRASYKRADF
jgi:hypothetical protein